MCSVELDERFMAVNRRTLRPVGSFLPDGVVTGRDEERRWRGGAPGVRVRLGISDLARRSHLKPLDKITASRFGRRAGFFFGHECYGRVLGGYPMTIRVVRTRHYEGTIWEVARTDDNIREYVAHRSTLGSPPFGLSCYVPETAASTPEQIASGDDDVKRLLKLPDDTVIIDGGTH